jgi:predicted metal-dependent hydrolase
VIADRYSYSVEFGGESIRFLIERTSRRKTVAISVGYEGIRVLAPADVSDEHILNVVRKKGRWVLQKQAGYKELGTTTNRREFGSGETFHYLGRGYRLRIVADPAAVVTRVIARGTHLIAPVPVDVDELVCRSAVRSGLRLWYQDRAKQHFPARAKVMAEQLGLSPPAVRIVDQSKRWGSCDARGRIRLNWRLIMAPLSLADYVIAHEACHILEHSHSRRFWRSLGTIMPDYEERVRRLDRLGHLYFW